MRNAWYVARRELGAIFVQPIAYIFAIMMTLITGLIFAAQISFPTLEGSGPPPTLNQILNTFSFLAIFGVPAVTMRLLSEEQQTGTIELLMTLPIRDIEVVVGKFLASFIFYAAVVALTLVYPVILLRFGNPDVGPLISSYVGVLLWGASLLGIGTMASAMSENQINAFMLAFGLILFLYLTMIPADLFAVEPPISTILSEMSLQSHLNGFLNGLVTAKDVLYYLIITAVSIFAAARILESRRWR